MRDCKSNQIMRDACPMALAIHPQPLIDESMSSWISRLASANRIPARSLLSAYLGKPTARMDLDMLEESELSILAETASIRDRLLLDKMVLSGMRNDFILAGGTNRRTWLSSTFIVRYCPICLQEEVPYYRLIWRLHFVPLCPIHKIALQNQAKRCQKLRNLGDPKPIDCARVLWLSSNIDNMIDKKEIPRAFGFPYSLKEFLGCLMLFVIYISRHLPGEAEWNEFRNLYYPSPCGFRYLWRTNSTFACVVIEKALILLERWSETEKFILQNKSALKRICSEIETVPLCVQGLIKAR